MTLSAAKTPVVSVDTLGIFESFAAATVVAETNVMLHISQIDDVQHPLIPKAVVQGLEGAIMDQAVAGTTEPKAADALCSLKALEHHSKAIDVDSETSGSPDGLAMWKTVNLCTISIMHSEGEFQQKCAMQALCVGVVALHAFLHRKNMLSNAWTGTKSLVAELSVRGRRGFTRNKVKVLR